MGPFFAAPPAVESQTQAQDMNLVHAYNSRHGEKMSQTRSPRFSPDQYRPKAIPLARQMLAEGGPDNVKARKIAEGLGVSVGTVYNLFGDLNELIFLVNADVYDELLAALHAAQKKITARKGTPLDQLLTLSETYLSFVATHTDLWSGVLAFNRKSKPRVPDWYRAKERSLFDHLLKTLKSFPGSGSQKDQELAAHALWAAVHGIITVSVGQQGLLATQEEVWEQIKLVVTAVAAQMTSATQKT